MPQGKARIDGSYGKDTDALLKRLEKTSISCEQVTSDSLSAMIVSTQSSYNKLRDAVQCIDLEAQLIIDEMAALDQCFYISTNLQDASASMAAIWSKHPERHVTPDNLHGAIETQLTDTQQSRTLCTEQLHVLKETLSAMESWLPMVRKASRPCSSPEFKPQP